jgi:hypothetical protein
MGARGSVGRIVILCVALHPFVCSAADPATTALRFRAGEFETFSTKDHPRAKGVHFTIAYPSSWTAMDAGRSSVVQRFTSKERGQEALNGVLILAVDISTSSMPTSTAQERMDRLLNTRWVVSPNAEHIDSQTTQVQGEPAVIFEYRWLMETQYMTTALQTWELCFIWV